MRRFVLLLLSALCLSLRAESVPFRMVSHNVWYGFTKKGEPRHAEWLAWMKEQNPDVVSLQELNGYTPEKLAADARAWGHEHSVLLKEDGFPTGFTSRTPITGVAKLREGFHHGLMRVETRGLTFYVVHFHPSNFERRIAEAELLRQDVASLPADKRRIVLIGDFNGFSPLDRAHYDQDPVIEPFFAGLDRKAPTARNLNQGKLDYGGLQAIQDQGYIDLVARFRDPAAPYAGTFPTPLVKEEDHGTDRRIDYIFLSPTLVPAAVSARILRDDRTGRLSDHYPLLAELDLSNLP